MFGVDVREGVLVIDVGKDTTGWLQPSDAMTHLATINKWLNGSPENKKVIMDFTKIIGIEGKQALSLILTRGKSLERQRKKGKMFFVVPAGNRAIQTLLEPHTVDVYPNKEDALKRMRLLL